MIKKRIFEFGNCIRIFDRNANIRISRYSLTSLIQMEHEKVFVSSSPVQACRPLQAKFYKTFKHSQNQRGTNSATINAYNSGWSMSKFQDLPKKRNPTSTQHNFLLSCSEDVKLSYQRQPFCQFEADENNRKCG